MRSLLQSFSWVLNFFKIWRSVCFFFIYYSLLINLVALRLLHVHLSSFHVVEVIVESQ